MITKVKIKESKQEMRTVLTSPFAGVMLLRDLTHPLQQPHFKFVGYVRYFCGYDRDSREALRNFCEVDLVVPRRLRYERLEDCLRRMRLVGFVSDPQYRALRMAVWTMNRIINRYKLIFLLTWNH